MRCSYLVLALVCASTIGANANEAHNQLSKLSDGERNKMLSRFMSGSGEGCQVTDNFYQGSANDGTAFWNVMCGDEKSFVISISADSGGSTQILDCAVLKAIGGGTCFKKF